MEVRFSLPYPVGLSVNHYLARTSRGFYVKPQVLSFRKAVAILTANVPRFHVNKVSVEIYMYSSDKRKRDVDNILKVVLDSMKHANVFDDDSQIHRLFIQKMDPIKGGGLDIVIRNIV